MRTHAPTVLPLPKKPVSTVTGMRFFFLLLALPGMVSGLVLLGRVSCVCMRVCVIVCACWSLVVVGQQVLRRGLGREHLGRGRRLVGQAPC